MPIAPSTYHAGKTRKPSKRELADAATLVEIERIHKENYGVYGIRKMHAQLAREGGVDGRPVARCTVARLMKAAGLRGITREKTPHTTRPRPGPPSRPVTAAAQPASRPTTHHLLFEVLRGPVEPGLRAAVGVHDAVRLQVMVLGGHLQRVGHQLGAHMVGHRISDHFPVEAVIPEVVMNLGPPVDGGKSRGALAATPAAPWCPEGPF